MPLFGLRFTAQDEDERAQKNTFTRWINLHLEEHSSSGRVNDLFEDIRDGVLLCHLIEVLTGEALQVCSPRVSKRVHHIANLTTALTVLRRRGLELVNNNASDIADGNPRIVLGLIWQIILHFQIETNMALLREWGWGSTSLQHSRETTPVRSPSSPIKQRLASLLSSGPSTSAETPKISVKQMKSSVEQVMLRWINAEVAQKVNLRVENMDRDWKDGVMFCALVHRWKPDVIDMETVRGAEPRQNLENAFELAQKHLGIKKLLEVDDVLCQKPDKRSIITYVSQFIRAFGESPPVEDHNVYAEFLEWLSNAYKLDLINNEQGMYFRLRREFIEYRSVFNTIMATKMNFTVEELAEIQERWETVRSNLEAAATSAEKRLPKPYSTLSAWTVTGQSLINTPLNLPSEDPHKCLTILQKMISEHNRHFIDMAAKQEELRQATETGGLGGRPVAAEYVEPLRVRMASLAEEAPLKLATLKVLHAHYTILAYLHDLEAKMKVWRSAESLQLLNRWIAEYTQLESENPRAKCNHYLETMKKTLNSEPTTKLDGEGMVKTCSRRSEDTLKAFDSLKPKLQSLCTMWTEWESELLRLEEVAKYGIANRTNTLKDESEAIRTVELKFDELVPLLSASARLASNQRLELLRMKVRHLSRFAAASRLVVDLVPSTSQKICIVTNVIEASTAVLEIEKNLRERSTTEVGSELKEGFEKMDMKRRLTALRKVIPKMSAVEHYLEELQQQLRSSDAYDRAKILDIVDQLEKEIDIIEREAASYVDCRYYRESLRSCTAKLHGEGTSSTKGNLEPPVDKQYVKEVISRAELILERRETNEDEVRASLNDMEDCNVILRDWSSKRLDELRTRWEAKQREFEEWQQSMDRIRKIGDHLKTSKTVESSTLAELRRIEETCDRMHLTGLEPSLRLSLRRLRVMVETVLEERLDLLRMSGEDDCAVAHTIVQEVGEELVTFCPQLDERHTEARRILRDKMELFRRLQNYYDAMKYLRNRNIAWNTITVAEIPAVSAELETLVERCVSEWENDASRLRADLLAISGSFFQLEFDRINEKLNLLTFEKEKLRDLMRVRLEYLDAARDFITSTDSSIDVTQMATPSDRHPDVENLTKDLCKNLEEKAGHLRELQDQAEMKISDLTISQRLKKFRQQIVGVADEDAFENAVRRFESLIANELPAADDPLQFLSIILQLKKSEESESKAFEDVNVLASSNHENAEKERITALYNSRQEQRKRLTLAYMYSYHDYLNALFRHHEEKAVQLINNRALRELQTFNDREWKQWKEAVGELESVLDASMRLRFRPEFADLQRKAFSLDSKIARSIASSAKYRRHEEKLALKLTQFEAWLNAMEDDMATVESMPPGDEQTARLAQLLSSCLSHQRLVGKLERLNIQNRSHVEQLCQKYYALISRLRRYDIEEGSLPLHVRTLVQAAPTQSQLSISSFGSSEVVDRPESVLSASSSVDVGVSSAESEGPLEKSIGEIRRRLHVIIQSYNDGPKPLPAATSDYNLLLNYLEDINDLFLELPRVDDAKKGALENSLLHLQEHFNEIKSQMQQEIEEEISISEKEKEILFELSKLEQRVKSREVLDHNIIYDLDQLQTQMDLLRMIRSQPRRFVESDLIEREGSPSAKTRHKRKVLVMVTNTVTTIIQVVEEHLLTIEAFSRDPVLEEKLALVKTNLRKLEEEVSTSPPELPLDTSAAEQSHTPYLETRTPAEMMLKDVPKNEAFAAAVVGIEQALNLAEDVNLENCNDPHVLSESLNLLERQQTSMDALSDIAEELSKEGFVEYIDTISLLQERLNSMKVSLTDRLSTLSTQEPIETVYSREESTSAGDHEEDFEMLVEQVRRGIESAETIAFAENSDINSLEKARQILDSHEPTLSILADIADEKAKSGDINYVDSVSSLTEQFNSVKYGIEDRLDQSGLEEAGDVYPKLSEVLVSQLLEGEDAPSAERVPQRPEESEGVEEQLKNMSNVIRKLDELEQDIVEIEQSLPIPSTSSSDLIAYQQGKTPKLVAKLAAIGDVPADLLPKKDDLSHRIDDVNKKLDDQVNDLKRFEEKTIELQNVIDECRDKLKSRDTAEPIEIVQKDAEDLAVVLATIDAIPQEELSPRNQLARDTNNIKEQAKEQLSTLRKALTDEEKAREKQDELKNRLSAIGDSLNKVDPENVDYAQQLVSSLEPELQKLGDIADICHQFAISSSPVVSHNDLDKTLPDQVRDLQKKCDDVKKKTEQVAQLNAVAPEILLISESLQQQPEEIPSNLNEQQAVLEDLETKKQRLENLLQTIPTGDATEELRQKSAWDLSKLKDLLKRLGDSVGDKLAALAAFNAARKDAEDQLLAITGPVSEEKTPDELKKDEESLVRLQQNISQLDRDGLDEEQRDEHAQLLDRINKSLDIIKQRRNDLENELARQAADESLRNAISPVSSRLVQLVNDADRLLGDAEGVPAQYRPSAVDLVEECKKAVALLHDAPKTHPSVQALEAALSSAENMIPVLEERANNWDAFVRIRDEADIELDKLRKPLDEVLSKPRRSTNDAKKDFDVISKERKNTNILSDKVRQLQELSELLDPLESAYADVRFIDVDAEQMEKQYDDVLNELSTEIEDENLLCDSVDHFNTEMNNICDLLAGNPSKENIENIEQFQIPALRAQLSMLKERHDEANHARKHVDPDSSRFAVLEDRMQSLDALLEDAKKAAEKDEQERLIVTLTIRLSQIEAIPLREITEDSLNDIEKQVHDLPKEKVEQLQKRIEDLRNAKEQQDHTVRDTIERLAKIEEAIAALPNRQDIPTIEDRLGRMRDIRESLLNLDITAEKDIDDRAENARKTIDDMTKRDEEELQKLLTEQDLRNNAIQSLDELEQDIAEIEQSLPIPSTSSSDLIAYQQGKTPKLVAKLAAIGDVPADLLPKKDDLSHRIDDVNKKLDDQVNDLKRFEEKTIELQNVIDECRDKLKSRDTAEPIEIVQKDAEDLAVVLATIDAIPQEELSPRNQLARDTNNIKEQAKEQLSTLRKALTDEEKAREKQDELKNRLSAIGDSLNKVDPENVDYAQQLVSSLEPELQKLGDIADICHQFAISSSPVVSHNDLDKTLPDQVRDLQKKCDDVKKKTEQVAQLNAVAPEILLISESLQQQPEEIPSNLNEQQAVLEDLETKKQRLENLLQTIPTGDATEELRQKSAWDLSKLKDLLKRLGDSVGDKLAALAAFNAARKDAEDQLLAITGPVSEEKTPDELKKDEESLVRLQQNISQLDRDGLDEEQRDEHAQLLDRINKSLDIIKQRRNDLENELARQAADESLRNAISPVSSRLVQLVNDADRLLGDAEGVPAQYRPSAVDLVEECKKAVALLHDAPKTHPSVQALEAALSSAENMIPVLEERANNWDAFVRIRDEADIELDKLRKPLDEVLSKPRRSTNDAKKDFDVISKERKNTNILSDKVRQLQELSELLDPLESAYADVRFIDVDAEQMEKQYDDVLNELSTEIEDENLLCDSVDHFNTEMNNICDLLAGNPSKENIENIEQFQIPALRAQLSMLKERHDEANHARKHVDPDSSRFAVLEDRMQSLDALLEDAKKAAEKDEQERLIVTLTIRLSQIEAIPLREITEDSLNDIEKQVHDLPKEKVEQLQKRIEDLRNAKEQQDHTVRDTIERLAKIEEAIAALPNRQDIPTIEDRLGRMRDIRESLLNLDITAEKDIDDRAENARKTIDDMTKRDEEELQKLLTEQDLRNNAIQSLDELEQDIAEIEQSLPIPSTSSSDLIAYQQGKTPKLVAKLAAIGDVPADLLPKKDDLSHRIDDVNKKLDDQVNDLKRFEEKTIELQNVIDECRDKLKSRDTAEPIEIVQKDAEDLAVVLATIDAIPQEELSPRNQLARDTNNIKEQAKEQLSTLRKALTDEEKAREKQDELKNRLSAIGDSLNKVDPENVDYAQQLVSSLEPELQKLGDIADICHQFAISSSPVVSHNDLDKTLPDQVRDLQKKCDDVKKKTEQVAQLNAVAPEILLISESLQQQPEEIPSNLNEQQAVLEDLETKKQRLENLLQTIPTGDATEELRQKSAWDLSKLKDLLKRLGDSVGDKLAALAAFNAARKDAEDQLLAITGPVSEEKTPDELKKDEESLVRLQQNISQLDRDGLDEEQRDEHAQLLDRINKSLDIIKQRRNDLENELARQAADESLRNAISPVSSRLVQLVNDADRLLGDAEGVPAQYRPSAVDLVEECKKAVALLHDAPKTHPSVQALEAALSSAENMIPVLEERANNWDAFVRIRDEADIELDKLRKPLDEVLSKPRRSTNDAKKDFDVISKERKNTNILSDKVRQLQELSELLDPLESAYADVRFIDVDAEQMEKQYDDVLNELSTEIEDENLLCDSVDHFNTEMNNICDLLAGNPSKENIENIEQFQIPALRAQLSMLKERHDEANHARKHVDPDSSRFAVLEDRMQSLDALLEDAKKAAEKDEQERLIVTLTIRLSQIEAIPLREITEDSLNDIEKQVHDLPKEKVEQLQKRIEDLRNAKEQQDHTVRDTIERLAKIEEAIAALPNRQDIPTIEDRLGRMRDIRESLLNLDITAEKDIDDRAENARKTIDDMTKRDEEELQKLLTEQDLRNNAIQSLDELEQDIAEIEQSLPIPSTSSSDLIAYQQGKTPKLVAKLAAIGDVPADLLPKKDDLSHRIDDVNKKLDDQVNDLKRFEEKTIELQNVIDECRDKLKSRDTAEPIEIVQKDAEDLAVVLATIDAIPQEELSPRNQLARDTNNIKEQAKEQLSTLRKALTDEEKAREKQDELKNRLSAIGDSLNKVDPENVDYAQQLVSSLEPELQKLGDIADICHQFAISSSPVVSHNDLDKTLPDQVRDLQKKCDDVKKKTEQVAQLNAVAPEILLISESLQQQPEEIPSNLNEQQAVLEDLETKKQRLENLLQTIPTGDATEELRQKSAWDLSKLKDLLKRLGDSVGDKLAALAAFNAARKDAEDQLLAITGPVSEEKTPDELKKDEESLVRLQQNISQLDRDGLDEEQRDEHAQLLDRINKSLDIIKQRRNDLENELARQAADESLRNAISPVSSRLVQLVNDADRLLGDAEGVPAQYRPSAVDLVEECKKAVALLHDAPKTHPSVQALEAALSSAENMIPVLEERANNWDAFVRIRDEADIELDKLRKPLDEVLSKPRRSTNDAKKDFDVISKERKNTNILSDKVRQLQELSELLDPLESAYADVRFIDVDAEQMEKQYDDVLNELSTEIEDENLLCDSVDHFNTEMNNICDLLAGNPSKENIENIEQFQIPALRAQLSMLKERHDEANHARKHVDPDSSRFAVLEDRMQSLDALLEDAKKAAEKDEQERLIVTLTIRLSQIEAIPLREITEDSLNDIEKQVHDLPKEKVEQLQKRIEDLRNAKEQQDHTVRDTIERLAKIEEAIAALPNRQDIPTIEDRLGRMRDIRESLLNLDITAEKDIDDRAENARKTIDDMTKRDEEELQKLLTEQDLRNNAIQSLDELEQDIAEIEQSLPIPSTSSSDLIAYQQGKTPKLVAKLAAIGDVPADLLPKKDDLSHRIDDVNKKLDDQVNDLKRFEEKTIELQNVIDECRDKLKSRDTAEPIEIVQKDAEDLAVVLATIDAIPQEELSPRNQLARDTNNIKEQAKEQLSTLRKALTDEEKAREKQDELKNRLSAIGDSLNKVDPENVDYAQQLVSSLEPELQKLGDIADICHQFAISSSPVVSHNDLDKTLPDQVRDLQKKCDDVKKKTEQVAQLNAVAPEILLISESLQQQPEEIPSNLNEQQAVLEDLETKKQRLENLLQTIPTGDATEELRQKSAWDLSKLKDLLKRLGDSVGDKLAALAAFNAARKDAEDQLLAITGPVSEEKTPDELKKDEESLVRLQQNISQLDRDGLDEEQRDEHAQLLDRINKSLDIIKQRRNDLEDELARQAADESIRNIVSPVSSRLVQLVNDADRLLVDAEGVAAQYRPLADELVEECRKAATVLRSAPATHPSVEELEAALSSAEYMVPALEERANKWDEFVRIRDEASKTLEAVLLALSLFQERTELIPLPYGEVELQNLKHLYADIERLRDVEKKLNELSLLLRPLLHVSQDVRFFSVDQERTEKLYEEITERLAAEITAEAQLNRTLEILTTELNHCSEELTSEDDEQKDRLSHESLLLDIIAHLENQKVIVERSAQSRRYIESSTSTSLDRLMQRAQDLLEALRRAPQTSRDSAAREEYDVDAAAEVLAALYPESHPYSVLAEHGFEGIPSDTDSKSELESIDGSSSGMLSPIPDTATSIVAASHFRRQRSRWRRVLRTALPLQAMLVLLLGAACLVPHCDDEYCCQLLNNFARSFDPSLEFINGPPPF